MGNLIFCEIPKTSTPTNCCNPQAIDKQEALQYTRSLRSNMILDQERNVFDDYKYTGELGTGSISKVSSVVRRDIGDSTTKHKNEVICFGIPIYKGKTTNAFTSTVSSEIYKTKHNHQNVFALKTIDLKKISPEFLEELRNEVDILRKLDHPNIVKIFETYKTKYSSRLYVIMELCSGGNLYSRIPYKEIDACFLVRKILLAVSYMHEKNVIHRDLKFENIMFESTHAHAEIKIIDFGLSKKFMPRDNAMVKGTVGTLYSMAPEVISGHYSSKVDLWSIGVITFMLLSNKKPFHGSRKEVISKIMTCDYTFNDEKWNEITPGAKRFVHSLLQYEPRKRRTAAQALRSSWIRHTNEQAKESVNSNVDKCFVQCVGNSNFKKIALMIIAHRSASSSELFKNDHSLNNTSMEDEHAEHIFHLRRIFENLDIHQNGRISYDEFKQGFERFHHSDQDLLQMFQGADIYGDGLINYTEFLAVTLEHMGHIEEQKLLEAFEYFDSDHSGFITEDNLKRILGKSYSDQLAHELIHEADADEDGKVSYEDFLSVFSKKRNTHVQELRNSDLTRSEGSDDN